MSVASIATRYAKSVIDLAQEQKALDEIMEDMKAFAIALESRDLVLLIKSPIIQAEKKQKIFATLFGQRFHKLTNAFFDIVIRKGREPILLDIVHEFLKQYKKLKNITTADLTTAIKVSDDTLEMVRKEIKSSENVTGDVELSTKVDPSIIGGFILQMGGEVYDASIREKLAMIKQEILDNSYIKSL